MLSSLRDECCIPYLDDILCYSRSFEDHMEMVRKVLQDLQCQGVKLRPEKCSKGRFAMLGAWSVLMVFELTSASASSVDQGELT